MGGGVREGAMRAQLRAVLGAAVVDDGETLAEYSRDASPYRRTPLAVVRPRNRDEVVTLMRHAAAEGLPLIPRGAGTSLAGQCVGDGIVVDLGYHLTAIRGIDAGARLAVVEPGVTRDALNGEARHHGLMYAPDPSTTARCTIGGMIGNNAWGLHAVRYGTTRDHLVGVEAVLADGSVARLGPLPEPERAARLALADREGDIHRALVAIVDRHLPAIRERYPSMRGVPHNGGYALDVLARMRPWTAGGPDYNPALILCGAEGTLGLITEATVRLVPIPGHRRLLCAHFDGVEEALRAVPAVVVKRPAAVELLDRAILKVAAAHRVQNGNRFWLRGDPGAVLLIEFADGTAAACQRDAQRLADELAAGHGCRHRSFVTGAAVERVWDLRRSVLHMLMEAEGGLKAQTGIEDSAVALTDLAGYYGEVRGLLQRMGLIHYVYGPVGMGSLHIRPVLTLMSRASITAYGALIDEVAAICVRWRGSFACKHGDGRMRGRFLPSIIGEPLTAALREVKNAFDPAGLLNPGKVLDNPPLTADIPLPDLAD